MIIQVTDIQRFINKALQWALSFNVCCYLDSNNFTDQHSKFSKLIAVGIKAEVMERSGNAFEQLSEFREMHPGWLCGFLGYDLKTEIENLSSSNQDYLGFPELYFFVPLHVMIIKENSVEIIADNAILLLEAIEKQVLKPVAESVSINIRQRFTKPVYINAVNQIKESINRGDIYVTNFCQEFFADDAEIDPLSVFLRFNKISPAPFTAFLKLNEKYILSASPERFLAKRSNRLISQPIKGTAKRGQNFEEDEVIKQDLRINTKELQENVMIVDLVRNDLTRSANPGTVKTDELFGIYSFEQVHQMISTVSCEIRDGISPVKAIKNAFPMGSMTGAPKISAMELMEQFEQSKRGVYSGAIGYFSPDDDFDFNVVIRTLLYNQESKYLSFQAGSAITFHADAEKEYDECLLKVKGIMEALGQPQSSRPFLR